MSKLKSQLALLSGQAGVSPTASPSAAAEIDAVMRRYGLADRLKNYPARESEDKVERLCDALGAERVEQGLLKIVTRKSVRALLAESEGAEKLRLPNSLNAFSFAGDRVQDWVFLDTETTGLSTGAGTVAFLTGVIHFDGSEVVLTQYLLTEFAGEKHLLDALTDVAKNASGIITYNGKCFDYPLLQTRYSLALKNIPFERHNHIDLVHATRRVYKSCWQNCRLQTAELQLFNLTRLDDIPGEEVPLTWHAFLTQGKIDPLVKSIEHNAQDLWSLVWLVSHLDMVYEQNISVKHPLGLAKWYGKNQEDKKAYELLREREADLCADGVWLLASLAKKNQEWQVALNAWHRLVTEFEHERAHLPLAIYYEYQERNYAAALSHALKLVRTANGDERRVERIKTKLEKINGRF